MHVILEENSRYCKGFAYDVSYLYKTQVSNQLFVGRFVINIQQRIYGSRLNIYRIEIENCTKKMIPSSFDDLLSK